ncbi:MAG: hypothetical protein GF418_08505 [Chitinivibrionales bacterium]|nr:hypothetical protein [Chitinivibrionales bacterium]MBD3395654.1 hypothetical protein [Chitinivibrionales bacterium]
MAHEMLPFDQIKAICEKRADTIVKETSGGRMLFTAYGARLLGMWPLADGPNPLWVSKGIEASMASGQWMTGGERLWIAPERSFFYENPRDFEGFHVPAGIDPGEYATTGELTFENSFALLDYSTNMAFEGTVARRKFEVIDDPFDSSLPCAAVRISDSVSVPSDSMAMCAWSLAQIYTCGPEAPGTVFFPVKSGAGILSYFNPIPASRAEALEGYARFKIDANDIYKLALRPEDMVFDNPVKAVYLSPAPGSDRWMCLIKRCNDMPRSQSDCVDIARDNPDGPLGATQAYNNGPGMPVAGDEFHAFGEMELQLNKGVVSDGRTVSSATHELLAYTGEQNQLLELAQTALGIASAPRLYE